MKRYQRLLVAAIVALSVAATGCAGQQQRSPEKKEQKGGGGGGEEKKNGKKGKNGKNGGGGGGEEKEDPIKSGVTKMQSELGQLKDAVKTGDTAQVTKEARQLDDAWEAFEPQVEGKNPEMHDQVESSLNIILAAVPVTPLDTRVINSEIEKLDRTLDELKENKGKKNNPKKVDMKTGAAAMRYELTQLTGAVEKGDTAKIQEHAKAADKAWSQFEEEAKEKNKEDYQKVEDAMHTILAESKKSPVDPKKLKEQIGKLDAKLAEMTK